MHDFWPANRFETLQRNAQGWLLPTDSYWRSFLERPELVLLPESCRDERRLHDSLQLNPVRTVKLQELQAVRDADARESYTYFLRFRDGVMAAGTLEAYYAQLFRSVDNPGIQIPPLFIDWMVQAILRNLLHDAQGAKGALMVRAAELLFRPQRIAVTDGRILCGDQEALDAANETAGMGDIGRLLLENKVALAQAQMPILDGQDSALVDAFWQSVDRSNYGHRWLMDLTHELRSDAGEGQHRFTVHLTKSHSALSALARVLERWIAHFHGVQVHITPLAKVEDTAWRWHIGLEAESTALLNDLYTQREVEPERLQRLVSLFRLDFANGSEMRADLAGKPVYLGLAMTPTGLLRIKPQNLLLNLPLASAS